MHNIRSRIVAAAGLAVAMPLATAAALPPAAAAPARIPLSASTPSWTSHARAAGRTARSEQVSFGVLLRMRNAGGMTAAIRAVSEPSSPGYRHYLTHAQFVRRYAPTGAQVRAVRAWLAGNGLHVTDSITRGLYLQVSGSAADVERTFGTGLAEYVYRGHRLHTNTSRPSIAASTPGIVRGAVRGVIGLDQGSDLKQPASSTLPGPPPGFRTGVQPCSTYYAQQIATTLPPAYGRREPYAVCGYVPTQYQGAYGETPLLKQGIDGSGVTVAITDAYASPTMLSDANTYASRHGGKPFAAGQYREIRPATFDVHDPADAQGWYGEETLDVEAVHGMAPGAKIVYVAGSNDTSGLDQAWANTIDRHVADVITDSWGDVADRESGAEVAFYDYYAFEAAELGITVNFSSGDDGDQTEGGADPGARTVDFPADNPYVTGVGGTSVLIGKANQWEGEYGWSTAYSARSGSTWGTPVYNSGGGGGTSFLYREPFYQQGVVPARYANANSGAPKRVVPDISMAGDPNTGFKVGETQQFPGRTYYGEYRIGGTSLSSPLLAGALALADQLAGSPIGFANPLYYELLGNRAALHDQVAPASPLGQVRTDYVNGLGGAKYYRLQTIDTLSGSIADVPGYDNETGVGSPGGPQFFYQLASGG